MRITGGYVAMIRKSVKERFTEIKGHAGMQVFVELTQEEFEFGKKKGDEYWLYIVFNLTTAGDSTNAQWVRFKNPTTTMRVIVREKSRYIY